MKSVECCGRFLENTDCQHWYKRKLKVEYNGKVGVDRSKDLVLHSEIVKSLQRHKI